MLFGFWFVGQAMFLLPASMLEFKAINTVQELFFGTHGFLIVNTITLLLIIRAQKTQETLYVKEGPGKNYYPEGYSTTVKIDKKKKE